MSRPRAKIPDHLDPAMRFILEQAPGVEKEGLELAAGIGANTLGAWLHQNVKSAKIDTVRKVLNALGYDLAIVELDCAAAELPLSPCEDRRRALRMAEDAGRFHRRIGL